MKRLKIYLAYVAVAAMFMTSCSKEESPDAPTGGEEMGTLSFTALLEDFSSNQMAMKQSEAEILPDCPDDVATEDMFVRVELERQTETGWEDVIKNGSSMLEVPVLPGSNVGEWMTDEGLNDELELAKGIYRIQYFGVFGPDGDDDGTDPDLLYLAPRENDADDYGPAFYGNFVSDALPSEPFAVENGQKKYVDVEVLCYDDHFVQQYGYLFFDFEEVDILYLCLFGNVCNEDGRHAPAVFRFDVWNYSGDGLDPKGSKLFSAQNILKTGEDALGQPYTYAEPVCVQLPDDADETDMYYGEVWLLHGPGVEDDELIRLGAFDEDDVTNQTWANYQVDGNGDSSSNYYHFREGCGSDDDTDPCLFKDPIDPFYTNDFNDGEKFISNGVTTGTAYDERSTAGWIPGSSPDSDAPLWDEGTYTFTTNPYFVHNSWLNMDNGNGFFILNGDTTGGVGAYFSITQDDVCKGDDYYVAFDILNVYNGASPANDIRMLAVVDMDELDDPDQIIVVPYNGGTWTTVVLRVKANDNGELDINFIDDNTVQSGNDFALDNVIISNDPNDMPTPDFTVIQ